MSDTFASPSAPGSGIQWADHKGDLLVIDVKSYEQGITTIHGETDAVRANVAAIDGPGSPAVYDDTLIFPKILVSQTKSSTGRKVLGRLTQGQAKAGQSAPWLLDAATADDVAKAEAWLKEQASSSFTPAPPF